LCPLQLERCLQEVVLALSQPALHQLRITLCKFGEGRLHQPKSRFEKVVPGLAQLALDALLSLIVLRKFGLGGGLVACFQEGETQGNVGIATCFLEPGKHVRRAARVVGGGSICELQPFAVPLFPSQAVERMPPPQKGFLPRYGRRLLVRFAHGQAPVIPSIQRSTCQTDTT